MRHRITINILKHLLNGDRRLAKAILDINRDEFLERMAFEKIGILPKTIDNIVYILNELYLHNDTITKMTPKLVIQYAKGE